VLPPLFDLTEQAIRVTLPFPISSGTGALVSFDGIVRDHNEGRSVVALEYSAYVALAKREGEGIVRDAIERFGLLAASCIHRTGTLAIGDVAVRVWASAAHRTAAFAGCAFIIDEVKARVPIWKRETYVDGNPRWVECQHAGAVARPPGR
jgi:molybdopterin synthase catalytic subunit